MRVERILGSRLDHGIAERLHDLEHKDAVEELVVATADLARRRFRATTSDGSELAIALPRDQQLHDGAVLLLDSERAIVVRVAGERWLRLLPASLPDAVELGYRAGNLHWRVRFDGAALLVALEAPPEDYLARLDGLVNNGRVQATVSAPTGGQ
jgi:urease accessory protein